ncbi:MAG: VOC family protein [Candidatus Eremiobacteraeota bacterium]|nr:VOC family protein [Candidatus Eremiobacteraeota bacterium]
MEKIRPFLLFDDEAEDAANFYTSIFENSKILNVARYGEDGPGPDGAVMMVTFELAGQTFMALNMFSPQETEPSFYVDCQTQSEIDRFWERLSDGGEKNVCGWLTDKFGVTWNIVPSILGELMQDEDAEKSRRVFQAMLQMSKLDIEELRRAYDGVTV